MGSSRDGRTNIVSIFFLVILENLLRVETLFLLWHLLQRVPGRWVFRLQKVLYWFITQVRKLTCRSRYTSHSLFCWKKKILSPPFSFSIIVGRSYSSFWCRKLFPSCDEWMKAPRVEWRGEWSIKDGGGNWLEFLMAQTRRVPWDFTFIVTSSIYFPFFYGSQRSATLFL